MIEERGNKPKRIFFLEGIGAGVWWHFMKFVFELTEVAIVNPFKKSESETIDSSKLPNFEQPTTRQSPSSFRCPHCNHGFHIVFEHGEMISFVEIL